MDNQLQVLQSLREKEITSVQKTVVQEQFKFGLLSNNIHGVHQGMFMQSSITKALDLTFSLEDDTKTADEQRRKRSQLVKSLLDKRHSANTPDNHALTHRQGRNQRQPSEPGREKSDGAPGAAHMQLQYSKSANNLSLKRDHPHYALGERGGTQPMKDGKQALIDEAESNARQRPNSGLFQGGDQQRSKSTSISTSKNQHLQRNNSNFLESKVIEH